MPFNTAQQSLQADIREVTLRNIEDNIRHIKQVEDELFSLLDKETENRTVMAKNVAVIDKLCKEYASYLVF